MVDGGNGACILRGDEQLVHAGDNFAVEAKVDEIRTAQKVDVPFKRRDFPARYQEKFVEVRLQFAHGIVLGRGIVVSDSNEIEAAARGLIDGEEDRARDHLAGLAGALAVAVPGMHVQIAAEPGWAWTQRLAQDFRLTGNRTREGEIDMDDVVRCDAWADVRHADQGVPRSRGNGSGQARRGGIREADG